MFPFELDRKTESQGTYPIVLVSYLIACTKYGSADEAAVVKGFLEYVISPEGQEAAARTPAPLRSPRPLTKKITPAVEAIESRLDLSGAQVDTTTNAGQLLAAASGGRRRRGDRDLLQHRGDRRR